MGVWTMSYRAQDLLYNIIPTVVSGVNKCNENNKERVNYL